MKTKLSFLTTMMPGANLGPENPLPDIKNPPAVNANIKVDETVEADETKYFEYGKVSTILPYKMQDGYDRDKQMREYETVVLENDYLYAVFYPQFGGKLWTLYDKVNEKHLLQTNPVFQPCNLALRNAWTSGGVEWNIGISGHTPYTLSPMHTTVLNLEDGTPVLRMYEWERVRQVSYQIDAYLPDDSKHLFLRMRLVNTQDVETPIYWWSNTAVYESEDTRVLCPADKAFNWGYGSTFRKVPVPVFEGVDSSYTTRFPHSMDMFFNIPMEQRRWEAALDGKGEGLVQTSTDLLRGRKLFMWGNGVGGNRWQEFLAARGEAYSEIQAGLANTQMERLPMPANAVWEWVEAYGYLKGDPAKVHDENWQTAYKHVDAVLENDLPRAKLDAELARLSTELDQEAVPVKLGSGWAALELARRGMCCKFNGEKAVYTKDSINCEQKPWLELLETGAFPEFCVSDEPAAYLTQSEWLPLLKGAIDSGKSDHWHAWLQLGVMYCAVFDFDAAKAAFETSFAKKANAWAKRNLAALESLKDNHKAAADLLLEAVALLPQLHIAVECGRALLSSERYAECAAFCDKLPEDIRLHGRIQVIRAQAATKMGDIATAKAMLDADIQVYDIREGEVLLSDVWTELYTMVLAQEKGVAVDSLKKRDVWAVYPIPQKYDFRMRVEE